MMYKYRLYGINLASNLQLDCYPHEFDLADLDIYFTNDKDEADRRANLLCEDDKVIVKAVSGGGKIYICDKKNIVVQYRAEDDLRHSLVHCIFGYVLSRISIRRNIYFLHGSSVAFDNSAVIFIGRAGSGKSSLAAGFVKKYGGKILSDDMTRIDNKEGKSFVYPGFPIRRLRLNTIKRLDINMSNAMEIWGEDDKYLFRNENGVFMDKTVSLKAIVYIKLSDAGEVRLVKENVKDALLILHNNFHNNKAILQSSQKGDYLEHILQICEKIPIFTLNRPKNGFSIDEQIKTILREIYHKG